MTAFEVYAMYVALKQHFKNKTYDYFKYQGKVKITVESFEARNDKNFFRKLAKYKDPFLFLAYNLAHSDAWIGEIVVNEESTAIYRKHLKIRQSLTYEFEKDLRKFDSIKSAIETDGTHHPLLIRKFLGSEISLETLVIMVSVLRPVAYWKRLLPNDPILADVLFKIDKYKEFVPFDRNKFKQLIKERIHG